MRKIFVVVAIAATAAVSMWAALPASAADDIVIPIDTALREGDQNPVVIWEEAVPADLVGVTCDAAIDIQNNGSVHPGNDIIVSTGGQSYTFEDFETIPGQSTIGQGGVTLGESIVVQLKFGEDHRSSGAIVLTFDCPEPPPETTTTTVVETTTTVPSVTTTAPPVVTTVPTDVAPQTTVPTPTTQPPAAQPETPTQARPAYTG